MARDLVPRFKTCEEQVKGAARVGRGRARLAGRAGAVVEPAWRAPKG